MVDVCEVTRGFPIGIPPKDTVVLMGHLEDAADVVLASINLNDILHGPPPNLEA